MDWMYLGVGAGSGLVAQMTKAEGWSRWIKLAYSIAMAFAAAAALNTGFDLEKGLLAALGAMATHGAFLADTPMGSALKWDLLGKILGGLAEVSKSLAGKNNQPPS